MTRGVTLQALTLRRGPEYADQAVTGLSRGFVGDKLLVAQGRPYASVEHAGGELICRSIRILLHTT